MTRTAYERAEQAVHHVATRRRLDLGDMACREIAHAVVRSQESAHPLPVERGSVRLTGQQRAVLRRAALGWMNVEIAADLGITVHSVKTHMQRLLRELGARDRAHAVALGFATGLLTAGDVLPGRVR